MKKKRIFTFIISLLLLLLSNGIAYTQIDFGTGVPWGELSPSEPLVLDENFQQGFVHFHSDETADMGNSNNSYGADGVSIVYGYKNDTVMVDVLNAPGLQIGYYFYQCAFAPEWKTAWAFRDSIENTSNVSNGFVEVSRDYGSDPPTVRGEFVLDLRALDYVEVIQWTHSSCGGNKRGVMCQFSLDDGTTWDTLRYQPGNAWGDSFTKDPFSGIKTSNGFRCDPSAYGMTWEDGIYAENVMLRFLEAGGQVPRIHDLKVYGTFTPVMPVANISENDLEITQLNREVRISEQANISVYYTNGIPARAAVDTDRIDLNDLPAGIYIIRAQTDDYKMKAFKVLLK